MAETNGDAVGQLVQEIFAQAEGPKKLLEYLLNQAMVAEVADLTMAT